MEFTKNKQMDLARDDYDRVLHEPSCKDEHELENDTDHEMEPSSSEIATPIRQENNSVEQLRNKDTEDRDLSCLFNESPLLLVDEHALSEHVRRAPSDNELSLLTAAAGSGAAFSKRESLARRSTRSLDQQNMRTTSINSIDTSQKKCPQSQLKGERQAAFVDGIDSDIEASSRECVNGRILRSGITAVKTADKGYALTETSVVGRRVFSPFWLRHKALDLPPLETTTTDSIVDSNSPQQTTKKLASEQTSYLTKSKSANKGSRWFSIKTNLAPAEQASCSELNGSGSNNNEQQGAKVVGGREASKINKLSSCIAPDDRQLIVDRKPQQQQAKHFEVVLNTIPENGASCRTQTNSRLVKAIKSLVNLMRWSSGGSGRGNYNNVGGTNNADDSNYCCNQNEEIANQRSSIESETRVISGKGKKEEEEEETNYNNIAIARQQNQTQAQLCYGNESRCKLMKPYKNNNNDDSSYNDKLPTRTPTTTETSSSLTSDNNCVTQASKQSTRSGSGQNKTNFKYFETDHEEYRLSQLCNTRSTCGCIEDNCELIEHLAKLSDVSTTIDCNECSLRDTAEKQPTIVVQQSDQVKSTTKLSSLKTTLSKNNEPEFQNDAHESLICRWLTSKINSIIDQTRDSIASRGQSTSFNQYELKKHVTPEIEDVTIITDNPLYETDVEETVTMKMDTTNARYGLNKQSNTGEESAALAMSRLEPENQMIEVNNDNNNDNYGDALNEESRPTGATTKSSFAMNKLSISSFEKLIRRKKTEMTRKQSKIVVERSAYKERDVWGKNIEFLLAVIGFAVDLGNVWRFPYVCYKNGGGAFLIPYTILFVLGGLPIFYMEMSLGQYFSSGCLTIWHRVCPIAKGIGYSMCILNFFTGLYYNTIISWAVFFFWESFTTTSLPWTSCNNNWNLETCRTIEQRQYNTSNKLVADNNATSQLHHNTTRLSHYHEFTSPTQDYFKREVLQIHLSSGIDDLGDIRKPLAIYLAIVFVFIYFAIWKGVKSTGKAVWITALLPYFILIPLLIRGIFLPGAWSGIKYYLSPQWTSVTDMKVWVEAAKQIYFSLGPGFGTLMALSSYNKFNHNIRKDALIAATVNYFASFISGFVIFSVLGYMAVMSDDDISNVATEGPGLVFEVYPEGLATMQFAALWSCFFFTMVVTLGIDSTFGGLESVITGLCDEYPRSLRRHRGLFIGILIVIIYVCSLPTTTNGGNYVIFILESYGTSSLLLIVLIETIVVCWIYGTDKFCSNLEEMSGRPPSAYWRVCWKYISPTILLIIFMAACGEELSKYNTLKDNDYTYPDWAPKLGLLITGSSIICIPAYAIYHLAFKTSGPFYERLKCSFRPNSREGTSGLGDNIIDLDVVTNQDVELGDGQTSSMAILSSDQQTKRNSDIKETIQLRQTQTTI